MSRLAVARAFRTLDISAESGLEVQKEKLGYGIMGLMCGRSGITLYLASRTIAKANAMIGEQSILTYLFGILMQRFTLY
jgi:hypothetical protein